MMRCKRATASIMTVAATKRPPIPLPIISSAISAVFISFSSLLDLEITGHNADHETARNHGRNLTRDIGTGRLHQNDIALALLVRKL